MARFNLPIFASNKSGADNQKNQRAACSAADSISILAVADEQVTGVVLSQRGDVVAAQDRAQRFCCLRGLRMV